MENNWTDEQVVQLLYRLNMVISLTKSEGLSKEQMIEFIKTNVNQEAETL